MSEALLGSRGFLLGKGSQPLYMCIHIYAHTHTHTLVCMYVCMYVYTYMFTVKYCHVIVVLQYMIILRI